jgi:apolipoprotein N-acyltransferase
MTNVLLSAFSGLLLALAFPKAGLWWLAWVALVPFFIALYRAKKWSEACQFGFCFGLVFFGIELFWVMSLFRFVGLWIIPGWICLVLFETLFIMLFAGAFFAVIYKLRAGDYICPPVLAAILWTGMEWLRAWGPFGVTVGDVGYSQATFLPFIQIAASISVYGISLLVVLANTALAGWLRSPKRWLPVLLAVTLVLMAILYGNLALGNPPRSSRSIKLSLIQSNVDQMERMNPRNAAGIFEKHENLTRRAIADKPDIIVWPETAVPNYLLYDPVYLPRIKELAGEAKAWLIIGTPHYDSSGKIYNSMVSISPAGEIVSRYDKQHLVPFGEYLPVRKWLYPLLRSVGYFDNEFSPNPFPAELRAGRIGIAPAICFESILPDLVRARVKPDSAFILTITNDSWFDDSDAPYQHLAAGVFRAIENRKYFVQLGNTGISAVIDPYGRILRRTRMNREEILTFEIPLP